MPKRSDEHCGCMVRAREWRAYGLLCLVMVLAVTAGCESRDRTARQVVVYCSVDQQTAEPILAEFQRQTGIRVLARFDTEASKTVGLVQKIRAEAARPAADVFWSGEIFYTIRLAAEGLLAEYTGASASAWPAAFRDVQGRWYGLALRGRVIGYSTDRVRPDEAPRCLEDLLDPRWKGRMVMADPDRGTTGGDVASWFVEFGSQRATEILRALKTNGMRVVEGNSTAVRMVATGQADVCLTDTDDVYAMQRNGAAVAMNPLRRNGRGTLAIPNTAAILRGAPHPQEAAALMEFLLGGPAEEMLLASDSHNWPVGRPAGPQQEQYAITEPVEVDYVKVAEALAAAKQTAREALR